jgi:hypothetical protein
VGDDGNSDNGQFSACPVGDRLASDGASPSASAGEGSSDCDADDGISPTSADSASSRPTGVANSPADSAGGPGPILRPTAPRKDFSLESAEREFILRALKETGWQRTRAAALLGITRATLHAKLKRYEIQPPDTGLPAELGTNEYEPLRA